MVDTIIANGKRIITLKTETVIDLHNLLADNYYLFKKMEPISPRGIKNLGLLESAIHRQTTGIDDYYKYDTIYLAVLQLLLVSQKIMHFITEIKEQLYYP